MARDRFRPAQGQHRCWARGVVQEIWVLLEIMGRFETAGGGAMHSLRAEPWQHRCSCIYFFTHDSAKQRTRKLLH
jgi:hypothetical protein